MNAKGEIGGGEELRSLLEYLTSTNDNTAIDTELKDIHQAKEQITEKLLELGVAPEIINQAIQIKKK